MVNNAYVIRIRGHGVSLEASSNMMVSSKNVGNDFDVLPFDATTPEDVADLLMSSGFNWTYPWHGEVKDMRSGLTLRGYETAIPQRRIACFFSHYRLWKGVVENDEPTLIFEHDAIFTSRLPTDLLLNSKYDIIGLNDPRGATRLSHKFWQIMCNGKSDVIPVPKIDSPMVPQGLAGNSAYFIKPAGAQKLLDLVKEHGAWPNDAIMCQQLMPRQLGVLRVPVTGLQKVESTTTL